MRILLLKPYQQNLPGWVAQPPLGLLYLASALRERFGDDVHVRFVDMKTLRLPPEWLAGKLRELAPDVVGVSALNCEAQASKQIAEIVKAHDPGIVTVLGGPYVHRRADELLGRTEFDWIFDSSSERSFPEAIARLSSGQDLGADIPGFSYDAPGGRHVSTTTDLITDLDALPRPAWDLVDFDLYAGLPNMMVMLKGRRYAPLFTSRGCPYKCNYCHDLFSKKFVHRSAEDVVAEIADLYENYGVDEFQIVDDIFNLHKVRLKAIMGEVARRWPGQLKFTFPNGLRADILDEPVLDALREAGTYAMALAVETVTPRLQTLVEKNLKLDRTRWAIEQADRRGIMVSGFFMLGFPTETQEEIDATIRWALDSRLSLASFFQVIPQPETPLYELAKSENAEALRETDAAEEGGGDYKSSFSWYERAYGTPLRRIVWSATLRFHMSPRRMWRVMHRVPPRSWARGLRQFVALTSGRDAPMPEGA